MTEEQIKATAKDLREVFMLADIDPGRDTLVTVVDKFKDRGLRHLTLNLDNGGLVCLCSNPEMSRKIGRAIQEICDGMESDMDKIMRQEG